MWLTDQELTTIGSALAEVDAAGYPQGASDADEAQYIMDGVHSALSKINNERVRRESLKRRERR